MCVPLNYGPLVIYVMYLYILARMRCVCMRACNVYKTIGEYSNCIASSLIRLLRREDIFQFEKVKKKRKCVGPELFRWSERVALWLPYLSCTKTLIAAVCPKCVRGPRHRDNNNRVVAAAAATATAITNRPNTHPMCVYVKHAFFRFSCRVGPLHAYRDW